MLLLLRRINLDNGGDCSSQKRSIETKNKQLGDRSVESLQFLPAFETKKKQSNKKAKRKKIDHSASETKERRNNIFCSTDRAADTHTK